MRHILWRNMKWRLSNPLSIVVSLLQPLLWLLIYSAVAGQTMRGAGIANYTAFLLPGLMVLVTFSSCCSSGFLTFLSKNSGSFFRMMISPVSRPAIVLGQMAEAMLLSFVEIGVLCLASLLFSVKLASGPAGLALSGALLLLTSFFMSGVAYAVSFALPNEVLYETIMNAIILPVFFLSSALVPVDSLSGAVKGAVNLNPFTHVINALRGLILENRISLSALLPVFLLLSVLCVPSYLLALYTCKKQAR